MAEGLCRKYCGDFLDAYSAGIETHGLNSRAVQVMGEKGIDISGHTSKTTESFGEMEFDFVVTVCSHAHETCPYFPAETQVLHRGFDDPPVLAANISSEEEILAVYRKVVNDIERFVKELPELLNL